MPFDSPWSSVVVDLDRRTGSQACVVACHAENNIPVAGEAQAAYGRWMHWIIIQRYWEGEYPNVKSRFMPVMCQQRGEAPCELVCPVFGSDGTGGIPGAPDFTTPEAQTKLREQGGSELCTLAVGRGNMPGWTETLTVEHMWQVLTYLGSLQDQGQRTPGRCAMSNDRTNGDSAAAIGCPAGLVSRFTP